MSAPQAKAKYPVWAFKRALVLYRDYGLSADSVVRIFARQGLAVSGVTVLKWVKQQDSQAIHPQGGSRKQQEIELASAELAAELRANAKFEHSTRSSLFPNSMLRALPLERLMGKLA